MIYLMELLESQNIGGLLVLCGCCENLSLDMKEKMLCGSSWMTKKGDIFMVLLLEMKCFLRF